MAASHFREVVLHSFMSDAGQSARMSATLFGIPTTVFWIDVCASWLFVAGLIQISRTAAHEQGVDKIVPFGLLFFAMAMGVFGSEHFTATASIAALMPRWIPAHTFWVYLVGLEFLGAAVLMAVAPGTAGGGSGGNDAAALRMRPGHSGRRQKPGATDSSGPWPCGSSPSAAARCAFALSSSGIPRFFVGIPSVFYGVQHLLHPAYVPGVPLQKLTPEWIHGRIMLSYFVGAVLIVAGICLLVNKQPRLAATYLGLTILLTVLWVYLPMLLAAPKDIVALNFFFDTLLFCGAILMLANATSKG